MVKLQNNRKRQTPAPTPQPFYKKWWFILIIIIIFVPGFARGFGQGFSQGLGDDKSSQTSTKTDSSAQVAKSSEPEKTKTSEAPKEDKASEDKSAKEKATDVKYKMGETIKVGDVEYVVNSKSTTKTVGNKHFGNTANGTYLIVNVTVKNTSKKPITVDSNYFKLLNGDAEYSDDSRAGTYINEDTKFFWSKVNPGSSITGNVAFDVSDDVVNSSDLQLQVQTGTWGTEKGTISLSE